MRACAGIFVVINDAFHFAFSR